MKLKTDQAVMTFDNLEDYAKFLGKYLIDMGQKSMELAIAAAEMAETAAWTKAGQPHDEHPTGEGVEAILIALALFDYGLRDIVPEVEEVIGQHEDEVLVLHAAWAKEIVTLYGHLFMRAEQEGQDAETA